MLTVNLGANDEIPGWSGLPSVSAWEPATAGMDTVVTEMPTGRDRRHPHFPRMNRPGDDPTGICRIRTSKVMLYARPSSPAALSRSPGVHQPSPPP